MSQENNAFDLDYFMDRFALAVSPTELTSLFNELSQVSAEEKKLAVDTVENFLMENTVKSLAEASTKEKAEMVKEIADSEAAKGSEAGEMLDLSLMLAQAFTFVAKEKGTNATDFTKTFAAEVAKMSETEYKSPSAHMAILLKTDKSVSGPKQ